MASCLANRIMLLCMSSLSNSVELSYTPSSGGQYYCPIHYIERCDLRFSMLPINIFSAFINVGSLLSLLNEPSKIYSMQWKVQHSFAHTCTNFEFDLHSSMYILCDANKNCWSASLQVCHFQRRLTNAYYWWWIDWRESLLIYPENIWLWSSVRFAVQVVSTASVHEQMTFVPLQDSWKFLIKSESRELA